jgi:hypothetical protein
MSVNTAPPSSNEFGATSPLAVAGTFLHEVPVDLLAMAEALGLGVDLNATLHAGVSGRILHGGPGQAGYHIEVNGAHSANRKRFTLAHEISHYLLHCDQIGDGIEDNGLYRSQLGDLAEIEANRLATQMLMPASVVRNVFRAGLKHRAGLSAAFQVSDEAMRIRLRQLGLEP